MMMTKLMTKLITKRFGLTVVLLALSASLPVAAARSDDAGVEQAMEEARRALESGQGELAEIEVVVGPGRGVFVTEMRGRRAMIGITLISENDEQHSDEGVLVSAVSPGGPAAEAGIRADDLIVRIDDTPLDGRGDVSPERALVEYLSGVDVGETVELTYLRDGDRESVSVTTETMGPQVFSFGGPGQQRFEFGNREGQMRLRMDPETGHFMSMRGGWVDMELVNLSEGAEPYFGTERGILVVRSPSAEGFELQDWDVITEIGGREPRDPAHAMRILRSYMPGEDLEITFYRNRRQLTLEIQVPELRQRYEELLIPE
jgi:PDZ domain